MYRIGIARRDVTPTFGMRLVGYLDRRNKSARSGDPILVNAFAVQDGGGAAFVLCTCDTLGLPRAAVDRVRAAVSQATGLAPEQVWIAPSHTHSAPASFPGAYATPDEARFADDLQRALVEVAIEALRTAQPARLYEARCTVAVGVNRRPLVDGRVVEMGSAPDRPVDHTVPFLLARSVAGEPIGCVVNIACHPVACGRDTDLMTSDYPGALRRHLELAGIGSCLFVLGACGDVNPVGGIDEDPGHADALGRRAADAVLGELAGAIEVTGPLDGASMHLAVRYAHDDLGTEHLEAVTGEDAAGVRAALDRRFPWESPVTADGAVDVEVAVVRIGDAWLASLPYEVFAQTGIAAREVLGPRSFMVTQANGSVGYLPTDDELTRGGYEVDESPLLYRLPGPPPSGTADRLLAAIADLKAQLESSSAGVMR